MAERWVALLRGINVGGANRLPMADLRATLAAAGMTHVVTYVQSGNVVFDHPTDDATEVADIVSGAIAARHGLTVPTVVRTGDELVRIAGSHPEDGVLDATYLHVVFFDRTAAGGASSSIDAGRFVPDRFVVDRNEAYVTYPNGAGRSKLTLDVFERALGVTATARNMNSVRKIAELATAH